MMNKLQFTMPLADINRLARLTRKKAWAQKGSGGLLLDLAEAVQFCQQYPPELKCLGGDFSSYGRATPDALEFLLHQGWKTLHLGLTELSTENASVLARGNAAYNLTNLAYLDTEVAAILSQGKGALSFPKSMLLSLELARELVKFEGQLHLKMDRLSLELANELARQPNELLLDLNTIPSEQILQVLCNHAGYSLSMGSWECQPESAFCGFVSPNPDKTVYFHQPENESEEKWLVSVHIEQDHRLWMDKRIMHRAQ